MQKGLGEMESRGGFYESIGRTNDNMLTIAGNIAEDIRSGKKPDAIHLSSNGLDADTEGIIETSSETEPTFREQLSRVDPNTEEKTSNNVAFSHLTASNSTPEYYKKDGFDPELPMLITGKHAKDIMTNYDGVNEKYHGLTAEELAATIDSLDQPAMVLASEHKDGSIVAVTDQIVTDQKTTQKVSAVVILNPIKAVLCSCPLNANAPPAL